MLENYITQVRRPKSVSSKREAFVSRARKSACLILKLNDFLFFCLFVCSELIEEPAGATN